MQPPVLPLAEETLCIIRPEPVRKRWYRTWDWLLIAAILSPTGRFSRTQQIIARSAPFRWKPTEQHFGLIRQRYTHPPASLPAAQNALNILTEQLQEAG